MFNRRIVFDDRILYKCYRNSRPLLVTAHALGFGIYRKNRKNKQELVQFFDQPQLWKELGYEIKTGELKPNHNVTLHRPESSSPRYLEISDIEDLMIFKDFTDKFEQAKWIADEIEKNIQQEELLYTDIMVINPLGQTTKNEVAIIRNELFDKGINTHITGESDANIFFEKNSVAFTGINRAKGNEVSMVYIINAHECYEGNFINNRDLIKRRNILFTAITRSKAWVRVCGIGQNMIKLKQEYDEVKNKNFELEFRYPTNEEIKSLNIIHRDISEEDKHKINQDVNALKVIAELVNRIKAGEVYLEDYPEDYQIMIKTLYPKL